MLNDGIKESLMENVLQIHTEAVSAQFAHFYEVSIRIIALLGPVERQTSYKRLTYFTSQLPFDNNPKVPRIEVNT